jgi:hypothetical protein
MSLKMPAYRRDVQAHGPGVLDGYVPKAPDVASRDPPPEQAEITNGRLDELTEKIRDIRYKR